jgi:hypothetical protein
VRGSVGVPFPISLSFWVELVGACNSIDCGSGRIGRGQYDKEAEARFGAQGRVRGELGAGRGGLCGRGAVSGRMGRGGKGPLIRGQ